jgi:hypothetical protein
MNNPNSVSPNIAGFPSKERPNKDKDKKYVAAWIRAIYNRGQVALLTNNGGVSPGAGTNQGTPNNIYNNVEKVRETRLWSRGLNDVRKYKEVFALNSPQANTILTGRNMNWSSPMDHVPYMDRLRNILTNRDTSVQVEILNKMAQDKHLNERMRLLANATLNADPQVKLAAASMGVDITPPVNEPQTPSEFEILQRMGSKPAIAATIRKSVEAVKRLTKYDKNVRPFIADALIDDGVLVMLSLVNNRGVPEPVVVRYENCLIPRTADNWKDMPWFGVRMWMTPSEIMSRMGAECTPAIRKRLEAMKQTQNSMPYQVANMVVNPNAVEDGIEVCVGYFKDYHILTTAKRKSDGIEKVYEESMDPSEYDIERTQYEVVYQGMWVVGTSDPNDPTQLDYTASDRGAIYFGCQLSSMQLRMEDAIWRTRIPAVISSYGMTDMMVQSIGARMMSAYEPIIMASLQLKALLLNIIPPSIIVDQAWLDNVGGLDGTGMTKRNDLIKAFLQGGVLVGRSNNSEDPEDMIIRRVQDSVEIRDAFIPEFRRLSDFIQYEMGRFERVAGFNEANNGGTIDERQAARNVQQMATAQAKALKPITDCMDYAEGDLAEIIYMQLQCVLARGKEIDWLGPFLGDGTAKVIELTAETDPGTVGITMRQTATEEERAEIRMMLDGALARGELTADDVLFIRREEDYYVASEWIRKRRETRAQQRQEEQMALVKQQSDGNMQASMASSETAMKKVQAEGEIRMAELQAKAELEMQKIAANGALSKELAYNDAGAQMGKLLAQMQAMMDMQNEKLEVMERIAMANNKTKEEIAEEASETKIETSKISKKESMESESEAEDDD